MGTKANPKVYKLSRSILANSTNAKVRIMTTTSVGYKELTKAEAEKLRGCGLGMYLIPIGSRSQQKIETLKRPEPAPQNPFNPTEYWFRVSYEDEPDEVVGPFTDMDLLRKEQEKFEGDSNVTSVSSPFSNPPLARKFAIKSYPQKRIDSAKKKQETLTSKLEESADDTEEQAIKQRLTELELQRAKEDERHFRFVEKNKTEIDNLKKRKANLTNQATFSPKVGFWSTKGHEAVKAEQATLVIRFNDIQDQDVKDAINAACQLPYNMGIDCRDSAIVVGLLLKGSAVVFGMYNVIPTMFTQHAWVLYKGVEYDTRAILETYLNWVSPKYTKIKRLRKTPVTNLKLIDTLRLRNMELPEIIDYRLVDSFGL